MSPAATHHDLGNVRFIPLTYTSNDSHASALHIIQTLLPDWTTPDSNIDFIRFTDGITNTLLKAVNRRPGLTKEQVDKHAVLLRAYGSGTAILIDREREVANHELLMRNGLAPELLARFENGMLYRYVPGTPCTAQDLCRPVILKAVAGMLAEWHARVPCLTGSSPTSRSRNGNANGETNGNGVSNGNAKGSGTGRRARHDSLAHLDPETQDAIEHAAPGKPYPNLWTTMQKWILALPTNTDKERSRQALLQKEMKEIVAKLSSRPGLGDNGLVFAHCDLLCANVIMSRTDDHPSTTVSFIDYEYATPSPAAFDLANHFAEWAGYDCDYSAVPTVSQRRAFIHEYVRVYANLNPSGLEHDLQTEEDRLMAEVDVFRGVPGFYWGIWASIQAMISDIDFDYATYSESRLGEYWAFKAEEDGSRAKEGREMPLREKTWSSAE